MKVCRAPRPAPMNGLRPADVSSSFFQQAILFIRSSLILLGLWGIRVGYTRSPFLPNAVKTQVRSNGFPEIHGYQPIRLFQFLDACVNVLRVDDHGVEVVAFQKCPYLLGIQILPPVLDQHP